VAHIGQETALRQIGRVRAFAGLNQIMFVAFSFRDFLRNSDDSHQPPGLVANGKTPVPNPFLLPVRRSYAIFGIRRFPL